jgi:hypothetical protein
MADGCAHAAHEVVASLVHGHLQPRLGGQALDDPDVRRRALAVFEVDAAPEPRDDRLRRRPAHLGEIDARHLTPWMEEAGGERAVVGEEEEPGGVEVEAADGEESLARRHQARDRRTSLGVVERAHHAAGLVERDRAAAAGRPHRLAVDRDRIACRVGAHAERAHDRAVHRHAPRLDERLGVAA